VKTGAKLFGFTLICLLLSGPMGPCGPASLRGLILLPIGFLSFGAAVIVWITSLLAATSHAAHAALMKHRS
jgi:hypothetical protein